LTIKCKPILGRDKLKNLCDNNLVVRKNFGEVPPGVEYELTTIGQKIMPLIAEMRNFAIEYENESIVNTNS